MAVVLCIPAPNIAAKLSITFPGIGELEFLQEAIDSIPRPSSYILRAINSLSPALAPVYMLIRVLDVIIALQNCILAIPKALPFNPMPIINCIKKLISVIAYLVPLLPPFAYIRLVVDIIGALRLLIEDMIQVIALIDQQVSRIKDAINQAFQLDDNILLQIGQCAQEDLKQNTAGFFQVLSIISKLVTALLGMLQIMASVIPGSAGSQISKFVSQINDFQSNVENGAAPSDYPPLGVTLDILVTLRDVLSAIESFGKAILGLPFNLSPISVPDLANP